MVNRLTTRSVRQGRVWKSRVGNAILLSIGDTPCGTWAEVELYRSRGEWGSRLAHGTNTWVITDYDRDKFVEVFTAH